MSGNIRELGPWRINLVGCTRCFQTHSKELASRMWIRNADNVFLNVSRHASNCILLGRPSRVPGKHRIASSRTECYCVALFSRYSIKFRTIFPHIYFCLHSLTSTSPTWNLWPARWGITIHRRMKKHNLRQHWHVHSRRQPIFIGDQLFEPQPSLRV